MHCFLQHNLITVDIIPLRWQFWRLSQMPLILAFSLLLLLDISAAFDTVDHGIFLNRLEKSFGVHRAALGWVRSYFTVENKKYCQLVALTQLLRASQLAFHRAHSLGQYSFLCMWQIQSNLSSSMASLDTNMLMISKYMVIPNQRKLHALFIKLLSASVRLLLGHLLTVSISTQVKQMQYHFSTYSKRHLIPTIPLHLNWSWCCSIREGSKSWGLFGLGLTMDEHAKNGVCRLICNTSCSQRSKAIHPAQHLHYTGSAIHSDKT